MRIGICGAQGTGKSTLSRYLARELELPLIEEQARLAAKDFNITRPSRTFRNSPQLAMPFEFHCLVLQLKNEDLYTEGFVSDRTLIDIAVYWTKWLASDAPPAVNRVIYNLCKRRAKIYNLVVYVSPEFPPEDDRFRSTNLKYQAEMDSLTRAMLKVCKPPVLVRVTGSVEDRVNQVISMVNNKFTGKDMVWR